MNRILKPELLVHSNEHFEFYKDEGIGIIHVKGYIYEIATDLDLKHKFFEIFRVAEASTGIAALVIVSGRSVMGEGGYAQYRESIAGTNKMEVLGYREENALAQFARLIYSLRKFVVAGFGGSVIGQFLGVILSADYRIAAESTVLSFPHVKYETPPPAALAHFLPHFVGTTESWRLISEGKPITAKAALELGLTDEVVTDDRLVEECIRKAKQLAETPSRVVEMLKASKRIDLHGLDERCRIESELLRADHTHSQDPTSL